jgi:hypothetical protein
MKRLHFSLRLTFLTPEGTARLNRLLEMPSQKLMPHSVAILLGVSYAESLALLTLLHAMGACTNRLLIYHRCAENVAVGAIPFGVGFPELPWQCPLCEAEVESYEELLVDLESVFETPVLIS